MLRRQQGTGDLTATSNLSGLRLAPQRALLAPLTVLAAVAIYFRQRSALRYSASFDPTTYRDFWPRRWGLVTHIAAGMTALGAGLAQLWLGLTRRSGALHRTLGRVSVTALVVGSTGADYRAPTREPEDVVYAAGLFMLSTAWVVTTSMAIVAVKRRALEQHREWMIRS